MNTNGKFEESIDMKQVAEIPIDVVEPNKIIQGEIVTIDDEFVYVNVGIKADGRINIEEFDEIPEIGDSIEVVLSSKRMIDGMYVFSKELAIKEKKWQSFINSYKSIIII